MKKEVREVLKRNFVVGDKLPTQKFDESFAMDIAVVRDTIDTCNSTGIPTILHIVFKMGDKPYLELDVPILPVNYSLKNPEDVRDFTRFGNPEYSKALQRDLGEDEVKSRSNDYTDQLMNYICHEIAKCYLEKKNKNDLKVSDRIKSLKVMEDFDLEPEGKQLESGEPARPLELKSFSKPITDYKNQFLICTLGLVKKGEGGKVRTDPRFDDEANVEFANVLKYLSETMFYYTNYEPQFHAYGE